ncbi:MAG: hypothetical protein JRE40_04160, partial [Deltaproteobacteria bacterium]|nr:hypothetical protein [Deltaproteobacteria bacterium]
AEGGGWYLGSNKAAGEKRHDKIKEWVNGMVDYAESEGVVMPKKKDD